MTYKIDRSQFQGRGNETDLFWIENREKAINNAANALLDGREAFDKFPEDVRVAAEAAIRKYPDAFDPTIANALNVLFAQQISK